MPRRRVGLERALGVLERRLPELYVICALVVTLLLALLTPPLLIPDEPAHAMRVQQLAHGQVLAQSTRVGSGGAVDRGLVDGVNIAAHAIDRSHLSGADVKRWPNTVFLQDELRAFQRLRWTHEIVSENFANTAVYPPVLYLPQVLGFALGEHLDLSIFHSLLLARLMAAWAAILLGWCALRLCATGRNVLFLILLLPTCLSLNASLSQDAVLFSMAVLAAAILTRPLAERRQPDATELWTAAAALAFVIGSRFPYLPIAAVLLLPALDIEGLRLRSLRQPALALLAIVFWVGAWQVAVHSLGVFLGPGADVAGQKVFLLGHPLQGAFVVLRAALFTSPYVTLKGLEVLGTNDIVPSAAGRGLFLLSLVTILVLTPVNGLRTLRARLCLSALICGTVIGISLAEYFIFTVPGDHQVVGLQSRYLIALLPFLLLLMPAQPLVRLTPRVRSGVLLLSYVVMLGSVLTIPWLASHRFYQSGLVAALRRVGL